MKHVFTAGAFNPETKTAGYAVMVTDGDFCDDVSMEGHIRCGGSPDACAIELGAIDAASCLLKTAGIGSAMLHPTHPLVHGGLKHMRSIRPAHGIGGIPHTDFGSGVLFALEDIPPDGRFIFGECATSVREAACRQAGLDPFRADGFCRHTGAETEE